MNYRNCFFITLILFSLLVTSQHGFGASYENQLTLEATALFPKTILKDSYYKVQPKVTTDGFLTKTLISSYFGSFEAVGPGMLDIRLNEIHALAKLQDFEASEEFQKGAKQSANEKWKSLKKIVDKPKETLEGVGEGIGRFFNRTVRTAKTGIQKIDDVLKDRVPGSSEKPGPGAKLPGASSTVSQASQPSKYAIVAQASGDAAVNILGFEDSRRKLAKRLQVDPYTTNHILDEKLDEITWSIFAGDLGVDVATSLIPGGTIVSSSTMATNWVWDTPPGDLRVSIEKKVLAMNINQTAVDRLLRHRYYSLTMQAAITSYLEQLKGVKGKKDIMPLILSVTTIDQARFMVGTLMMINQYHKEVKPVQSIETIGTIIAHTADGTIAILAPADYLSWSKSLETFSRRVEFKNKKIELYVPGVVTKQAHKMLDQHNWQVHDKSDLFGFSDR